MTKETINGYSYRVTQASKSDLVVITYDIMKEYIQDALADFENQKEASFRNNIKNAKRSVHALMTSLDMRYEMSVDLFSIYRYMNVTLQQCSIRLETDGLNRIIGMLVKLRNSFQEVSKQDDSGPVMKNAQTVYAGLTYSNMGTNNETYKDQGKRRGFTV